MESQAIGPTGGQTATVQAPNRAQPATTANTAGAAADHKRVDEARTTGETDVRTRDPRSLHFQVDGDTHQIVTTIVDESNHVVIRQIPDAEVLRIAMAIDRMQGFLLEGKA